MNFDAHALFSSSLDTGTLIIPLHRHVSHRQLKTNVSKQLIHLNHFTQVIFLFVFGGE